MIDTQTVLLRAAVAVILGGIDCEIKRKPLALRVYPSRSARRRSA